MAKKAANNKKTCGNEADAKSIKNVDDLKARYFPKLLKQEKEKQPARNR